MTNQFNDILVVAWDGLSKPFHHISIDTSPVFKIIVFNYSGNNFPVLMPKNIELYQYINAKTEFKGELINELCERLLQTKYDYIGIIDDDHAISVSALNYVIGVARRNGFHAFQPSISHDSFYSHKQFLNDEFKYIEKVDWIEIMCPFLTKDLFEAGKEFYKENKSSYGLDKYLYPYLIRKLKLNGPYLIHGYPLKHTKKVTEGDKVFSNNLDARQEAEVVRKKVLFLITDEQIQFTKREMHVIFEVGVFRWQKLKYDLKRYLFSR